MSEIEDRRQRAHEAAYDAIDDPGLFRSQHASAIEAGIETATRVQITPEMIRILQTGGASDLQDLRDIFAVAGFEVVE